MYCSERNQHSGDEVSGGATVVLELVAEIAEGLLVEALDGFFHHRKAEQEFVSGTAVVE